MFKIKYASALARFKDLTMREKIKLAAIRRYLEWFEKNNWKDHYPKELSEADIKYPKENIIPFVKIKL